MTNPAGFCPNVRCDMSMVMILQIFPPKTRLWSIQLGFISKNWALIHINHPNVDRLLIHPSYLEGNKLSCFSLIYMYFSFADKVYIWKCNYNFSEVMSTFSGTSLQLQAYNQYKIIKMPTPLKLLSLWKCHKASHHAWWLALWHIYSDDFAKLYWQLHVSSKMWSGWIWDLISNNLFESGTLLLGQELLVSP